MSALISFLTIVTLTMLVTRVATVALVQMGLSREIALFQVTSALSGTGFTTAEAEFVVNQPLRRRLLIWLMRIGNVGVITLVSSFILTFVNAQSTGEQVVRVAVMVIGLLLLWYLATNKALDRVLSRWIKEWFQRHTELHLHDYESLLGITAGYRVVEIEVEAGSWLVERSLAEANISAEGLLVLGIYRPDGRYVGSPNGHTRIVAGDKLIVYGNGAVLDNLAVRLHGEFGNQAHRESVARQQLREQTEAILDAPYSSNRDG